jgi:hypothetical protein
VVQRELISSSAYEALLDVVRQQVAMARTGDVAGAICLMDTRQALIDRASNPSASDALNIQEILKLDRELAGLIRERMLRIREESMTLQRGRTAMRGYAAFRRAPGDRLIANC